MLVMLLMVVVVMISLHTDQWLSQTVKGGSRAGELEQPCTDLYQEDEVAQDLLVVRDQHGLKKVWGQLTRVYLWRVVGGCSLLQARMIAQLFPGNTPGRRGKARVSCSTCCRDHRSYWSTSCDTLSCICHRLAEDL